MSPVQCFELISSIMPVSNSISGASVNAADTDFNNLLCQMPVSPVTASAIQQPQ